MNVQEVDQAFYDLRWAGEGDITPRERNRVSTTLSLIPGDCHSILDIGCGDGFLSNELIARGKSLVAADISEVALARVQAPTLLRSADSLWGVGDQSFDLVLCTEMLEHLDEKTYQGALREFNRVARKSILITVPNCETMRENTARCGDCGSHFHIWGHRRRFVERDLRTLFPDFQPIAIVRFGDNLQQYNRILLELRIRLADAWAVDDRSPCPNCHSHRTAAPKRPRLAALCDLANANLFHLGHKPWFLALYGRK